jgi:hypothetical protein
MNAEIAVLLPSNEPLPPPKHFPENLAPEHWLRQPERLKHSFTQKQVKEIIKRRLMAIELLSQGVAKCRVAQLSGIDETTLEAIMAKEWEAVSTNTRSFSTALRQAGAKCVAKALSNLDHASFKDAANAATGFIARSNDLDLIASMQGNGSPEPKPVEALPTDDPPEARIAKLLGLA